MAQFFLALRLARREMRAGFRGLRVFILCLTLGVAAIAAVGMMRAAITSGLTQQASALLGGDAQIELSYRFATPEERQTLARFAARLSEIVDFRSMAVVGEERALVQVKAVDAAYPLVGQVELQPAIGLDQALARQNGLPGAVMAPDLAARLGLVPGDSFELGGLQFRLGALLLFEPDASAGAVTLAPRILLLSADLAGSALLQPGSMFETRYRLVLPEGANLAQTRQRMKAALAQSGARWSDRRQPAPGIARFVGQLGAFLVLVGIAGLAVGGVGISAALRAWLGRRTETIATLKVLGAPTGLVFRIYLLQAGAITLIGIAAGLALGVGLPLVFARAIAAALPFPAAIAAYPRPILEAGFYGAMTALVFALWPLAQAAGLRAAVIYRGRLAAQGRPGGRARAVLALAVLLLLVAIVHLSGEPRLALWTLGGIIAAILTLMLVARGISHLARWLSARRSLQGRVVWRPALAAIGAQPAETRAVIACARPLVLFHRYPAHSAWPAQGADGR
jgi:putative ABC transport system permease protein